MSDSEQERHRCEVRFVLAMREKNKDAAHDYLELVRKHRRRESAEALRADCASQWKKGNRGQKGEWR